MMEFRVKFQGALMADRIHLPSTGATIRNTLRNSKKWKLDFFYIIQII